ncbi:uncharacterized protein LOC106456861 [Limulus polyphemus]|uniref:Uncharacterized protein LOC106456861 n=1 Tax=Limulus polyphemus TaxID=6850 RepID=A0ABM1AZH4_LIMPO|nr:uncharacterized protein LOC106456861 [Limulus polyphemus]
MIVGHKRNDDDESGSDWDSMSEAPQPVPVNSLKREVESTRSTEKESKPSKNKKFERDEKTGTLIFTDPKLKQKEKQSPAKLASKEEDFENQTQQSEHSDSSHSENIDVKEDHEEDIIIEKAKKRVSHKKDGPSWSQLLNKKLYAPSINDNQHIKAAEESHVTVNISEQNTPFSVEKKVDNNKQWQVPVYTEEEDSYSPKRKIKYFFDHGNPSCYSVEQDVEIQLATLADRSQSVGHQFWGELFTAIQIPLDFIIALLLELLGFCICLLQRLLVGALHRLGDLLLKPVLAVFFNSILYPIGIFLWNSSTLILNILTPLLDILKNLTEIIAIPLRAFRLVEIRNEVYPKYGRRNQSSKRLEDI